MGYSPAPGVLIFLTAAFIASLGPNGNENPTSLCDLAGSVVYVPGPGLLLGKSLKP